MNEAARAISIERAMNLFWQNGYAATTMRDLQKSLDMRPGSVYSAFGGKDELYAESLRNYSMMVLQNIQAGFQRAATPFEGIVASVKFIIFPYSNCPSQICFLIKSVTELEYCSPELADIALEGLVAVRNELEAQIGQIAEVENMTSTSTHGDLAMLIQAQIIGLKAMLSMGFTDTQVDDAVEKMINKILFDK